MIFAVLNVINSLPLDVSSGKLSEATLSQKLEILLNAVDVNKIAKSQSNKRYSAFSILFKKYC